MEPMNAAEDETGQLRGTDRRTNVWAWRHPHRAEGTVTYTRLQGSVVLDHVDFGYDEKKLVLHDISLWAKPGQKIAFAGATGAGKTTITNLINRFYDIADGFIRRSFWRKPPPPWKRRANIISSIRETSPKRRPDFKKVCVAHRFRERGQLHQRMRLPPSVFSITSLVFQRQISQTCFFRLLPVFSGFLRPFFSPS